LRGPESFNLGYCYHNFLQLATGSILVAGLLSVYLYAASFGQGKMLAAGGNSDYHVYNFFIGRELNPRFSGSNFDLKEFCELKPGLIGWVVINLGMAYAQYELKGEVSYSMYAVNIFQGLYVWDALYNEKAVLTTMDITTDGFGFMLAFGDLCWVPFTYTLQARYLVENDPNLSPAVIGAICVLNMVGYATFRGANGEKDAFRRDPTAPGCRHLKTLDTKRGTKLIISGWWGLARKINYTGDWCMGLAWCLTTGTGTTLTYFYAIYFAILLVHRASRDDAFCYGKYGADWAVYKTHVPAVFIPYIF